MALIESPYFSLEVMEADVTMQMLSWRPKKGTQYHLLKIC